MVQHFSKAALTAQKVASIVGEALGRKLAFAEQDDFDGLDGEVDITSRVHIQVGGDYLIVNAWVDEMTMKSWPERRSLPSTIKDVMDALKQYPEAAC